MKAKHFIYGLSVLLVATIYKEYDKQSHLRSYLLKFIALWENKLAHVSFVLLLFLAASLMVTWIVEYVFRDVKEIERMTLLENTKTKFIDMAIFAGNILFVHREDSFNAISMFALIMIFANLHWLSTERLKDHLAVNKLDGGFLRLVAFMAGFFTFLYYLT